MRRGHQSIKKEKCIFEHKSKYLGTEERKFYFRMSNQIFTSDLIKASSAFYDKYLANLTPEPGREAYSRMRGMYKAAFPDTSKNGGLEISLKR